MAGLKSVYTKRKPNKFENLVTVNGNVDHVDDANQNNNVIQANGRLDEKRSSVTNNGGLNVPGSKLDKVETEGRADSPRSNRSNSVDSRRGSSRSIESRLSAIDFSKISGAGLMAAEEEDEEDDKPQNMSTDNFIRQVIPYLPLWLAVFCLILNIFIPGTGTMLSGLSVFCCGKSRVETKDEAVSQTVCGNLFVGISQLFTVTFMLVGWFWSLVWGIYMVILAVEHRRREKRLREKELQAMALKAFNPQMRPWTLKAA